MCFGIPGQVIGSSPDEPQFLRVSADGVERNIQGLLLDGDPPQPGDWVLIHLGFALERLSPEQAADLFAVMAELGEGDPEPEPGLEPVAKGAPWSPAA